MDREREGERFSPSVGLVLLQGESFKILPPMWLLVFTLMTPPSLHLFLFFFFTPWLSWVWSPEHRVLCLHDADIILFIHVCKFKKKMLYWLTSQPTVTKYCMHLFFVTTRLHPPSPLEAYIAEINNAIAYATGYHGRFFLPVWAPHFPSYCFNCGKDKCSLNYSHLYLTRHIASFCNTLE